MHFFVPENIELPLAILYFHLQLLIPCCRLFPIINIASGWSRSGVLKLFIGVKTGPSLQCSSNSLTIDTMCYIFCSHKILTNAQHRISLTQGMHRLSNHKQEVHGNPKLC